MLKLCLEKVPEIVDVVNAVPHCNVLSEPEVLSLNDETGVIRLDVTFGPLCSKEAP